LLFSTLTPTKLNQEYGGDTFYGLNATLNNTDYFVTSLFLSFQALCHFTFSVILTAGRNLYPNQSEGSLRFIVAPAPRNDRMNYYAAKQDYLQKQ